jgi:hypothetical protein
MSRNANHARSDVTPTLMALTQTQENHGNDGTTPPSHGRVAVATRRTERITLRAIALGALLIPLNGYWIVQLERVMYGPYPSTISLFANVVFVLFLLMALNFLLRRTLPRYAFSQGELLTIYTMLAISTGLAGLDGVSILNQIIPLGAWFGTKNGWDGFLNAFPDWLVVRDHDALRGHFLGNSSFYRPEVLHAWIVPMLAWTLFFTLLMLVANCINVLVRRQWADHERLTFPIIWLPLEMTEGGTGAVFFRNPLMWGGFALAAGLSLWNGIAFLYPSLPTLPLGITDLKPLFSPRLFSATEWFPITLYPLAIGLSYLLPLDLLFSCWFFFLFWRTQEVVTCAMGWDTTPDFPFIREQGFGSLIGLFAFYLWTGRRYYAAIWRRATTGWGRGAPLDASTVGGGTPGAEALSERGALLGLGLGLLGLLLFCHAAHMTLWVSVAFFAVYIATITVITRIRAELGPPVHDFHFMGPDAMMPRVLGANAMGHSDLAFFTFSFAMTRAHRSDTMPVGLEGLQMAHLRQLEARRMFAAILLATALGTLATLWAFEHQAYHYGVTAKFNSGYSHGKQSMDRMANWVGGTLDAHPNTSGTTAIAAGVLTTLALAACRLRWFGFPFHPIGYAISSSWAIGLVWMPMLIAWLLKGFTMRYGGLRAYKQFLPFFLGLILGDCVMGSIWALISLLMGIRTYNFFGG